MSNKIIYQFNDGDGTLAHYDVNTVTSYINNTVVEITYSESDTCWSEGVRGQLAGFFHDDGDSINIHLTGWVDDNVEFRLNYSQIDEVIALLDYYNKHCGHHFTTSMKKFKEVKDEV